MNKLWIVYIYELFIKLKESEKIVVYIEIYKSKFIERIEIRI